MNTDLFQQLESNVRSYCRDFPVIFKRSKDAHLYTEDNHAYIDFIAGAGALNYGHNNDYLKQSLLDYLMADGITHGLDLYTHAKYDFLSQFKHCILEPRQLDYKIQFCGPTGSNAVEAALKLARKITERTGIFAFMGGFHGMSLGSLAATSNQYYRAAAGTPLNHVNFMPYPHDFMASFDSIEYIEQVLTDSHSGIDKPAAILVETIQAEGGVIVAPDDWLQNLSQLCQRHDILLICDDIQVGCGRTGTFFSFEAVDIQPDIITLSKSLSAYGLPMSVLLCRRQHDIWQAGEHNGTFRGNQLAFVTATAALRHYWSAPTFSQQIQQKSAWLQDFLNSQIQPLDSRIRIRGKGMIWGIDLGGLDHCDAKQVIKRGFENGLMVETCGRKGQVIKMLPPLTIGQTLLAQACDILKQAIVDGL